MTRSRYVPGLDGIRALAVVGVLAYHAGVGWAGGGLLGVDVFFVLSGYLITSLLVREREGSGTISLRQFWARRARRLLPALFLMLAGVAAYGRFLTGADSLHQLRGDALSTLLYFANWHYVFAGQSYFVHYGAPSPLLHTWSLAVEEQFYLVWPLLALVALRRGGRGRLALLSATGALASAGLTAALYATGSGVSRLYYGTDVRAQELMVGCLLALAMPALSRRVEARPRARRSVLVAGLAGAGFLGWALHGVSGDGSFLYEGGFLAVSAATAALVALVVLRPQVAPSRALSWGPVRYLGRISYGLYVYHWPIFLALDHAHTGVAGPRLLILRLTVTLLVAAASFHLVEEPIRSRRVLVGRPATLAAPLTALVAAGALVAGTSAPAVASVAATPPSARELLGPAPASARPPAGTPTVDAVIEGDSIGWTFANGLRVGSTGWGVAVDNQARLGCDLDPTEIVNITGVTGMAAQGCAGWQTRWADMVASRNPDVVGLEVGRWEISDRIYGGHWITIGDRAWDTHLTALLTRAVDVLSSRGARVVLFTTPYVVQNQEQPDGRPWPVNLPSRVDAFNALLRRVAASRPKVATVVDLNRMLCPNGHYTDLVDGVQVRSSDREHISLQGGELVRSAVLPTIERLGVAHARHRVNAG